MLKLIAAVLVGIGVTGGGGAYFALGGADSSSESQYGDRLPSIDVTDNSSDAYNFGDDDYDTEYESYDSGIDDYDTGYESYDSGIDDYEYDYGSDDFETAEQRRPIIVPIGTGGSTYCSTTDYSINCTGTGGYESGYDSGSDYGYDDYDYGYDDYDSGY